jgi:hypothetical protein
MQNKCKIMQDLASTAFHLPQPIKLIFALFKNFILILSYINAYQLHIQMAPNESDSENEMNAK